MIESLLLLLLFVGLAGVAFYLGFIRKVPREPEYFRGKAQVGFIACSVFSVIWMSHIWNLAQVEPQLAKYVVPYPGAKYTGSLFGGFVDDDASWLATVDAPPHTVISFYLSPENVPGWTIAEASDVSLVYRKEGAELVIFVTEKGRRGSTIMYSVSQQE